MSVERAMNDDFADEKEAAIISAARETFLARGFDAASMDAIALAAGVSKRTVYNRFRSKEALFAASIMDTCKRILPVNFAELSDCCTLEELVANVGKMVLHGFSSPEAIALRRLAAFEAGRTPALGKAFLENGPRWIVKEVKPVLEKFVERGELDIANIDDAIWQLGALLTEPLYTEMLMGVTPDNLDAAIDKQVKSATYAFFKIYPPRNSGN